MKTNLIISAFVIVVLLTALFVGVMGNETIQPILYNHNLHVEDMGLECSQCHQYYETDAAAGLPTTNDCAECHSDLIGESEEEQKLVSFITDERELDWKRIFQLPRHVFFSHRRHIILAEMECSECHGVMEKRTEPPQMSDNFISMDFCIDCHEKKDITIDCMNCHR